MNKFCHCTQRILQVHTNIVIAIDGLIACNLGDAAPGRDLLVHGLFNFRNRRDTTYIVPARLHTDDDFYQDPSIDRWLFVHQPTIAVHLTPWPPLWIHC